MTTEEFCYSRRTKMSDYQQSLHSILKPCYKGLSAMALLLLVAMLHFDAEKKNVPNFEKKIPDLKIINVMYTQIKMHSL